MSAASGRLWEPGKERVAAARVTAFLAWLEASRALRFADYESLWRWSVESPEAFWDAVWQYFGVIASRPYSRVLSSTKMLEARWFEGAELNFVDQVFRYADLTTAAIIFESEAGGAGELSWPEFQRQVQALAATLRDMGVVRGDRVAAYLPNIPQTIVSFLAVASIGAVWSVCGPDLGQLGVVDRFRQIAPKVLIACDGYRFAGRPYDRRDVVSSILGQLPSVESLVWVPHLDADASPPAHAQLRRSLTWGRAVSGQGSPATEQVPADHPLWIVYSSGTTGLPKAIVHGHGGIVANGVLTVALHNDLGAGDRICWTSSTSWIVWNAHVLSLLVGATLLLFDGSPTGTGAEQDWSYLWRLIGRQRVKMFGTGAAFHHACLKAGIVPRDVTDLSALCTIGSTGSALSVEGHRWLYEAVKADVWVNCLSGGTDICGAFVGGLPTLPVHEGEMQCRVLGAAVHAFNDAGQAVLGEVGELVCTKPLPSMPLYFWGDEGNVRYLDSYFSSFAGPDGELIWRHGDWLRLVARPEAVGAVIYGRSDATINRQGIRMGTAELYRAIEAFDEVLDSLAADLEYLGRESYMVLFVVLRPGKDLSSELKGRLLASIRTALSPRHVPNDILQAPQIPRTLTGKKLELPIKRLLLGEPAEKVLNRDSLANPSSLDWFIEFARSRQAGSAS